MNGWLVFFIILVLVGVVYAYNNPNIFNSVKNSIPISNPSNIEISDYNKKWKDKKI